MIETLSLTYVLFKTYYNYIMDQLKNNQIIKIGFIGIGKMGKNLVLRLLENNIKVVAWNRSPEPVNEVVQFGAQKADNFPDLVNKLSGPRIIWLMLPAGTIVDDIINQLLPLLSPNDLIIDGGNSFYKDSIRRGKILEDKGIRFMDFGVSGGPSGARNGACLMIGGDTNDYQEILPIITIVSAPDAYKLVGPTGAGHFVKMVHNGIEYGMVEAIAEGSAILEKAPFQLNLSNIFTLYNQHSVIESRLVGWTKDAFMENPKLTGISSIISHTGEADWTVKTAKELGIEVPVIESSLNVRVDSEKIPENFRNKVISALRGKFGQHKTKSD
jgi:6-phosphogluconate dehydrogenase